MKALLAKEWTYSRVEKTCHILTNNTIGNIILNGLLYDFLEVFCLLHVSVIRRCAYEPKLQFTCNMNPEEEDLCLVNLLLN